jgi:hypothetical protein
LELRERERELAAVRSGEHAERHRRRQHQERAGERVDHELRGGAHPVAARAPAADQEVERHQHQVEEDDEERQVLRHEGAEHGGLGEREVEEEEARTVLLRERGHERARHPGDRRQGDHEQVDAVHAERVADAELGDPLVVRDPLEPAGRVEVHQHNHDVREHADRSSERRPAGQPARQQGAREPGGEW